MNKTFKSVWNESLGTYVAASEDTAANGRKASSTRAGRRAPRRGGTQRLVLEPRIVFDGALPVAAADAVETKADNATKEASVAPPTTNAPPSESNLQPAHSAQQERALIDGTLALDGQTSNEIIFIDSAVEGLENFLLDHPQADVVLLDAGSDGMEQIAATLEGRTDIEAIHILSHGSSGQINLGDATFNLQSINGEHADELATIKSALSAEADILIYGCDVGAEESGQAFISALSEATGADIAASTDLTGAAELGGDWDLESKTGTLETDSFVFDSYKDVLLDPIVDLNSDPTVTVTGPVITVTTATTNLVTSGDFGTTTTQTPPAPWLEAGTTANGQVVLDGSGDGRYDMTAAGVFVYQNVTVPADTSNTTNTSSSTATTTTDVSTTVATTNEITSISFDMAWQNADVAGADDNSLYVFHDGTIYARFDTVRGNGGNLNQAGLTGTWTYFNGASGPATTLSVANETTGALTNITINLPTGVNTSGLFGFWHNDGSSGAGSDDIAIDNVVVNNTETTTTSVTTTVTTADTADNDWTATFTENGPAVSIADIDSSIFDGDSTNMASAAITLTNQATGDRLLVNGSTAASGTLASGIAWTRTDTSVNFLGVATKAQYANAIELVQFENTTDNPSTTARIINVTANDGTADSNTAVATINVTPVDDIPVNTVPAGPLAATEDTSLSIAGISVLDLDAGNPTEVASTVLSVNMGGTLIVTAAGGAVVTNNGTNSVTITGNAAAINATLLNNVNYQGASNFSGTETLNVLTTDTGGVNSDSDNITINVAEVYDPIVDLNSGPTVTVTGPVVTVSSSTTDLATSGDFGTTAGQVPPAPWVESGQVGRGRVVNDGTGDMRYRFARSTVQLSQPITVLTDTTNTTNTSSSTETTTTDVSTTVTTANEIGSITFDMAWQNADVAGADDNQLRISYNGILYATFDTIRGNGASQNQAGLTGTWTYFNGASGPATTLSVTNETTGALTSITISLPAGVTASGSLDFLYANGSSGNGSDDVAIDNVVVNNVTTTTTSVTTTVTTADTADNDWTATFTENGPAVSIADIDSSIFDGDSTNMASAAITLTNQATGDRLLVNGSTAASGALASGIAWTRTDTSVSLSGSFTKAQYANAIELVQFENTTDNPSTTARIINVTVNDGSQDSNTAVATINVAAVNDAPVNTVPGAQSVNEDTALLISGISVNDVDNNLATTQLSVGNGTVTVSLAGGATISSGTNGSATLTLSGTQAQINAALATVSYQGNLNFNGVDTLTVLSTDSGGTPLSDTDAVTINVAAVNDAPVNTVPGAQSVNEDTALLISGISVNDVDNNLATTQLSVGNGTVTVSLAGGATISSGTNGSATLTLSGTQAQINAALATVSYQGNLNFNGVDTLTVLSTDSGGTPLSDTDAVTINVAAVNDAPVNTVPGAQSVNEDTALLISGISVNDVDNNLATTQLSVGNGTVTVSLAGGATISSGTNGSATLTLSGTQAQINAALATVSYQGNLNFNGVDTLTVLSTDSGGTPLSDTDAVTINVAAVNDAPVNTVPGAQSVNEDTALLISGISVNDVDNNLATTQLSVGNGTVTVSLAGGATISSGTNGSATLTLSGTQAQINAALATVSYQGNLNFNGVDTLTVLSTDSGGTPLSDTDAVTINVAAVNDAPVNTVPGAQSVNEDTALLISGISVNDVDNNLATTQLSVGNGTVTVSLAGGATISSGTNGSATLTLSGTQAQINAALATVSYQGNLNFNGVDTLTVLSTDSGGTPLSDTDAVTINVAAVNDAPVNTVPGAQSVNEDTALLISGISVNDVDNNLATTQLSVGNGTVTVSLAGGATISSGTNGSATLTLSGTQAQINAALATVSYQGNLNFNGVDTLTVLSTDSGGTPLSDTDAVTINVAAVNDAPVNTVPGAQSVNEDTALLISGISVNDVDNNLATTQLSVGNGTVTVSLAGGATISSGTNGSATLTLSGTQAQINAALATVSYQGNLNFNGVDTLTVLSTDSGGTPLSDTDAVTINVAAVNDAPVNTVPGAQSVNEDTALLISGISVNDVDNNLATTQLSVGNGTVTVSLAGGATISSGTNGSATLTLSGTQAQINAALATVSYQGNLNFNGVDTLTVLSTDSGGTPLSDTDAVTINVAAVNDAPVNTVPGAQSVNEDTALLISGISVNDVDNNLATTQLSVGNGTVTVSLAGGATISSGTNGSATLTLSGTQAQINAALATVSYQGNLNFNGVDTLTVLSTDSGGTPLSDTDAVTINVAAVNDAPVNTVPGAQSVNEDTALLISGISVNDVDNNLATTQLSVGNGTVTVSLAGGATISSGTNGSATLTLSGTQAQINAALATVSYQGNLNFNGVDTLTVLSTDSGGTPLSDTDAVTINVAAVNDAPVNTVPGAQSVNEDTALLISGISVNDVDNNLATTQLSVGNGTVTVSLAGGATISSGTNGSATLTLSGTQAQINAALATVSYQGNLNFNGVDTLTVLSTDSGGTPLSDTDAVTINVAAVNDAPVNTVPGAQSVNEDTALLISGISVNDVDNNLATTQLSVGNGTVTVSLAGGATISSGTNGSATLTLSGTQAQINAALATVSYQGNLNFNGVDTLTVLSTDSGGTPLSDTDAVTINVAAVNDAPAEDRLPIEPEWFLNTDSINNEIFKWQITNDPTSPVLSTIQDIRKETALNSGQGVFQTDSATKAELIAGSNSDNSAPTYVQNSVRHLDLGSSSASIERTVKTSQLESAAKDIRAASIDNTAIPAVSNIVDPFAEKAFKQSNTKEDIDANLSFRPTLPEKQLDKGNEENKKSQLNTRDLEIKRGYTVDSDSNAKLDQKDRAEKKDSSETNITKEKTAKSFSNQLQHMATNTRAPSNGIPSNK